jgi:HK97 gp10 family phage protein
MATRVKFDTKPIINYLEDLVKNGKNIDLVVPKALKAGGGVLLEGMKKRVRKDTRNLEKHLEIDGPHQDGNYHFVKVGLSQKADAETPRYANAQEYGTSSMPAQSYIRATEDHDLGKARKAMLAVIKEELFE